MASPCSASSLQQRITSALRESRNLTREPDNFLAQALADFDYTTDNLRRATSAIFRAFYYAYSMDLEVDEREARKLNELARLLVIDDDRLASLTYQVGLTLYAKQFREAVSDGELTSEENQSLDAISRFFGLRRSDTKRAISQQALAFYSFRLAEAVKDGELDSEEREELAAIVQRFGITRKQLRAIAVPQKAEILRTALASIKAKGEINDDDRAHVQAMTRFLNADELLGACLKDLDLYDRIFGIRRGELSELDSGPLILENGEKLHYKSEAIYETTKRGKVARRSGTVYIGSYRLRFVGVSQSHQVRYANILQVTFKATRVPSIELAVSSGKGGGKYRLRRVRDPGVLVEIEEAIRFLIRKSRGLEKSRMRDSRYVPDEVRREVWYRDGGRCVICGSDSYLELDHIIPWSKGGATSVDNLQLLCRKCNSEKSDQI